MLFFLPIKCGAVDIKSSLRCRNSVLMFHIDIYFRDSLIELLAVLLFVVVVVVYLIHLLIKARRSEQQRDPFHYAKCRIIN